MKYICLIFCVVTSNLCAAISAGQWQCMAFDSKEQSYQATAMTIEQAMRKAVVQCKSESKEHDCKSAQSFCEQGAFDSQGDRCMVNDESGRSWDAQGDEACKKAMEQCNNWQFLNGNSADSQCTVTTP